MFSFSFSSAETSLVRGANAIPDPFYRGEKARTHSSIIFYRGGKKEMEIVYNPVPISNRAMSKPRPDHVNLAIAAASSLVMGSMNRAANDAKATARSLSTAIIPAFGISRGRDIIHSHTRDAVNQMLMKLLNSPLPRLRYDKLAGMFKTAYCNPYSLIPEWDEWKQLADAYMLDHRSPQEAIAQTITFLTARCVPGPDALAIMDAGAIETMAVDAPSAGPLRTLWRLSRAAEAAVSPKEHLALPAAGLSAEAYKKAVRRRIWPLGRKRPPMHLVRKQMRAPSAFGKL